MAKRLYENDYPSVTEVLGVLRKIGLEIWFKRNTEAFCNAESYKGKTIGKHIHEAIDMFLKTGKAEIKSEYGDEVVNALNSFMLFRKENPLIAIHSAEMALTSEKHGFNGTIDAIGEEIVVDWKSGKAEERTEPRIFDEWKYQVAAYVYLYNEIHKTAIDRAIIVAIAKDKVAYNKYEMGANEIADCFNEVFLPALKITNYQKGKKQYVL